MRLIILTLFVDIDYSLESGYAQVESPVFVLPPACSDSDNFSPSNVETHSMTISCKYVAVFWVIMTLAFNADQVSGDILFVEDFDSQTDWTSDLPDPLSYASDTTIPDSWFAVRQSSTWHPSNGNPDNHDSIEILASNADKARGGAGKSFVGWRESRDLGKSIWQSEGLLMKYFSEGHDALYVSFWVLTVTYIGSAQPPFNGYLHSNSQHLSYKF